MAKLVPLIYHKGNRVTLTRFNLVVDVIHTIKVGEQTYCPHCGAKVTLRAGCGSLYAYYLDIPHTTQSCCTPFMYHDLKIHHDVNHHTLASYIHFLKKKGTKL